MSQRVCQGCGTPLPPKTWRGRDQKWCSVRCRKAQYDLVCVDCGGRVDGTTPGKMANRDEPVCGACAHQHYARWTCEAIIEAIQRWHREKGKLPSARDWRVTAGKWPPSGWVQQRFGSWNAAIEAAGFTPRNTGCYGRPGEDPAVIAETAELYRAGMSGVAIAARMGVAPPTVYYRLDKAGVERRPRFGVAA